ncbi:hypothetical protein F7725_023914 [Dissostichus mawsoni]|uniref:Deleted in malignant brain tumors 1 protein n=1 Tax=Dissostichus mawsoni TaxID=36200 RepID=A0A7J5XYQ7_DISMA|nr:hypothetical protein F7725_023914 [Dissostichus mawsoni]
MQCSACEAGWQVKEFAMWTLVVLCSVIASLGVQGADQLQKREEKNLVTGSPDSCLNSCGNHVGNCSCSSSCGTNGDCCPDYYDYCSTAEPAAYTARPSCRYNCGWNMGSCSCASTCQYYGNCCHDYNCKCQLGPRVITTVAGTWEAAPAQALVKTMETAATTITLGPRVVTTVAGTWEAAPAQALVNTMETAATTITLNPPVVTTVADTWEAAPAQALVNTMETAAMTTILNPPVVTTAADTWEAAPAQALVNTMETVVMTTTPTAKSQLTCQLQVGPLVCNMSLLYCIVYSNDTYVMFFTVSIALWRLSVRLWFLLQPNHPNHYHDNAYCVWQLRAAHDQRIFLSFDYLQLENCCGCDYINVYDGPSVNSRFLGKVCNDSLSTFYSTSNYMTVLFRTDSSVVGRGFNADFISSLPASSGRVDCSSDNMNIVIERSYLNSLGYDGQSLYLNDQYCRPQVSRYQVVFNFPINTCGNVRKFENGRIVYTNSLRAYASTSGEITRQSHFKMNVGCRMEPDSVSQIMYVVRHNDNSSITGTGRFNTSMAFYTSYNFYYQVTEVPYMVTLNQYMYVQVDLRRGDSSLVLYLDTCVTSPSPHDFQNRSYYLVRNGCPVDNTYYAYVSGTRPYARFRFQAFQFLRATESVYIQCKVLICPASDNNSRCRRGCYNRAARDVGSKHDSQTLVLGPIQFKACEAGWQVKEFAMWTLVVLCSVIASLGVQGADQLQKREERNLATGSPDSCLNSCGNHVGNCSCSSSCGTNGDCCPDYYDYCSTAEPAAYTGTVHFTQLGPHVVTTAAGTWEAVPAQALVNTMATVAMTTTLSPPVVTTAAGTWEAALAQAIVNTMATAATTTIVSAKIHKATEFIALWRLSVRLWFLLQPELSQHYHDNAYCVWQLRAAHDQRIFLSFADLQLENCCGCDYINVYDGPSVSSRFLGKVCNDSLQQITFYSTSNYMTVLFRTDSSVVGRGFNADFISSLPASSGRVDCSSDNMNIVIERSYLNSLGYDVQSFLQTPGFQYQVVFNFPINTCGNVRKFENGRIVYTNSLRAYASTSGEITRQSHFKMNVGCRMEPDSVSQIMYVVRHNDNSSITGTGRFNTSMEFYTSNNFYYQVTEVPYMVTLNQYMYVQVDLGRGDSSLVLYLDTCVTSPSPHDFQNRSYYLVRNGCPVDNTYYAYVSGTRPYARFRFQAFQFLRATESVYIQCKVLICPASDNNSRCRRGCYNRAARDVGSKHDSQTLVLGPIQLKEPEKQEEETPKQEKA